MSKRNEKITKIIIFLIHPAVMLSTSSPESLRGIPEWEADHEAQVLVHHRKEKHQPRGSEGRAGEPLKTGPEPMPLVGGSPTRTLNPYCTTITWSSFLRFSYAWLHPREADPTGWHGSSKLSSM
jgi:hypothetical protein